MAEEGLTLTSRAEGDKVVYTATITYPKNVRIVFTPRQMQDYLDRLLLQGMIDKHGRG